MDKKYKKKLETFTTTNGIMVVCLPEFTAEFYVN